MEQDAAVRTARELVIDRRLVGCFVYHALGLISFAVGQEQDGEEVGYIFAAYTRVIDLEVILRNRVIQ